MSSLDSRVEVLAVCDSKIEEARRSAKDWGIPHVFTSYRDILERKDIAAVSICLPHSLHARITVEALAAGKHVLVEKPLAVSLSDADRMREALEQYGRVLMVVENVRFDPLYKGLQDLLREGTVGTVIMIRLSRIHNFRQNLEERRWFLQEPSGGIMFSGGIHDVEAVRMLCG
jgi:predicted dehydrogenase